MEWRGSRVLCDMDFEGIKVCFVWDDKRMKQRVSESSQAEMARSSRSEKSIVIASVVTASW